MVKYQSIADGETGVELLPEIVITFSEPMHFRSIKKNLFFKEENITDVTCDVTIDSDLKKITIKPYNFLKNNSVYNILIKKDARTAKLYPLPNDIEINFITTDDDTIKPEILGTNIDDRLDDVAGNDNIIVYFSKPMDLDSFQNNILLKDNADATIDFALSASGVSAFIKPIEPLAPYGEYTLIIKNDAYDTSLFKNKLKDGKTINFKVKGEYKLRSVIGASKYLYAPSFVAVSDINGERYLYTTSADNKIRMYKKNKDVSLSDNNPYTDPSSDSYILIKEWSVSYENIKAQVNISGIDIDDIGNVFVTDFDFNRIVKYTYDGNYIGSFGRSGDGYGEFNAPYDVAYGKGGFIYVVDKGNYRVQKFDLEGNFITSWGTNGNGEGEFSDIRGITTDFQGNVYVINSCVKDGVIYFPATAVYKYDPDGVYIGKIGGDGKLIYPADVAIDEYQTAYVSDRYTQEICIYDKFGVYLDKITTDKRPNGLYYMDDMVYIAEVTDKGVLSYHIADKRYNQILSSLFYLTEFENNLSNLNNPLDIAIDNSGDLIVVNSGGYNVKKYDFDGKYLEPNENYGTFSGAFFFYPVGIDVDKRGRIFIADPGNTSIETFDSDFNFIKSFGQFGNGVGNFYYPYHIDISES
ncbi:MAG: Ig-like domain-containing protein, partial [Spirochaetes bacterium]|nr:Ig-like domain-containing protein [Spirochaetota bacterium]